MSGFAKDTNVPTNDCISRQAAIEALERIFNRCEEIEAHFPDGDPDKTGYKMFPDYMTVWKYLHQLPSAERKGHWIGERLIYPSGIITFIYRCSECGCEERHAYEDTKPSNYCPDCGARMEEEA